MIVFKSDFSKQIIVTKDYNFENLSGNASNIINEQSKTVFILNIITNDEYELHTKIKYTYQVAAEKDKDGNQKYKDKKGFIGENFFEFYFKNNFQNLVAALNKIKNWLA